MKTCATCRYSHKKDYYRNCGIYGIREFFFGFTHLS